MPYFDLHSVDQACLIPGGLKTLNLVDPRDLATQPSWNVAQDAGSLDFLPGKAAYYIEQDLRSGRLTGDPDISNTAGDFYNYKLQASVRSIRATMESLRAKLHNRRVHVIGTYRDGLQRFVPYMRLAIADDSGARRGDKQGYTISGTTRLILPGPGVGGNIATVPPPVSEGPEVTPGSAASVTISTSDPNYTFEIEAGQWLVAIMVRSTDAQTVQIGLSPGTDEIGGPVSLAALQGYAFDGNQVPSFDNTNIYFSGLEGTNTIKIWLLTGS